MFNAAWNIFVTKRAVTISLTIVEMSDQFVCIVSTTKHSTLNNRFTEFVGVIATCLIDRVRARKRHVLWLKIAQGWEGRGIISKFCLPEISDATPEELFSFLFGER